jgi:hypothetical protein
VDNEHKDRETACYSVPEDELQSFGILKRAQTMEEFVEYAVCQRIILFEVRNLAQSSKAHQTSLILQLIRSNMKRNVLRTVKADLLRDVSLSPSSVLSTGTMQLFRSTVTFSTILQSSH